MTTFTDKTRRLALMASNGYCQCSDGCTKHVTEFHHKMSNTKVNQRLYPIFLQSIFNCCPINHDCHMTKPLPRIRDNEATAFEDFLKTIRREDGQEN